MFYGHGVVTAKRWGCWGVCKGCGEIQQCPEPDASLSFLQAAPFNQWCSLSRKYCRAAVEEIENQISPYDLSHSFMQMPWLTCDMRGEGTGFAMAQRAVEGAHWKAAALEELHHCCSSGDGVFASFIF